MQLGRFPSLNHTINVEADPTPGDVEHAVHAARGMRKDRKYVGYSVNHDDIPTQ